MRGGCRCRDAERRPERRKHGDITALITFKLNPTNKSEKARSPVFTGIRLLYLILDVMFTVLLPNFTKATAHRQRTLASKPPDRQEEGGPSWHDTWKPLLPPPPHRLSRRMLWVSNPQQHPLLSKPHFSLSIKAILLTLEITGPNTWTHIYLMNLQKFALFLVSSMKHSYFL